MADRQTVEPAAEGQPRVAAAERLSINDFEHPISLRHVDLDTDQPGQYLAFNKAFYDKYGIEETPKNPGDVVGRAGTDIDAVDQQVIDTATSVETQIARAGTVLSLSKLPVIRNDRVIAILTINTDITALAATSSERELLAVAADSTESRLSLYRTAAGGELELVFSNRAAAAFHERVASNADPLAEQSLQIMERALETAVATAARQENQVEFSAETCVVQDEPLIGEDGSVAGVARWTTNITATIHADWTEQLLGIATLDDTTQAIDRAFEIGGELLGLSIGILAEFSNNELIIHRKRGVDEMADRFPAHPNFLTVLDRDEVLLFRDIDGDSATGPIIKASGMRTMAAIPIRVDGSAWGLLALGGREARRDRFPERSKPLLETLGGTLSHMLERDAARRRLVPVERLQKSNRELEEYAYAAAHDLRSPLRSMSSFSQLLKQQLATGPDDTERLFRYADRIISGADQMTGLLQSMLEHAKAGESTDGDASITDLGHLVAEVVGSLDESLRVCEGTVTSADALPRMAVNAGQFQRVVHNLLDNALKYRHPDRAPTIHIDADTSAEDVFEITFADNGIGIPAEHRDQVFGLFKRLTSEGEGTGVGLAVVRRIVEENEGSIRVGDNQGGGSVFTITMPRSRLLHDS